MMKSVFKNIVTFSFFVLCSFNLFAQQFKTHAVKEGETLESIAKQYKVTPFNILQYNKEVKSGEVLKPSTILVIPLSESTTETISNLPSNEPVEEVVEVQQEPIGFTKHKVKKRETLYGIAQRYHITEDDIKRYNTELYASQLKKGMRLKIPKYLRVKPEEELSESDLDFEAYMVQPKETRWSIAHKYGITIDSLLALNPQLPKNSDQLAIGQELKLPKPKGSSLEEQEVQIYLSYTVPAKQTFYSMEKKFGVTADELMKLNPEIQERGGLKEGMVLRVPEMKKEDTNVINTDNFVFYEVKPKQTEYSLTRKFGISYRELVDLNPELTSGLKAGMVLKLPKEIEANLEVRNSLILDKINLLDSISAPNRPKILVMLPFRLDRVDVYDKEETQKTIEERNEIKYALGLYSGALVALDSIKKLGVSVDVKTFDTELSVAKTKEILLTENLMDVSAILGPLHPSAIKEVAVQAANYNVPVIAPLTQNSDISLGNVFFSVPTDSIMRDAMLTHVERRFNDENIIVIADSSGEKAREKVIKRFPTTHSLELKNNIALDIEDFISKLSIEKENWVFLESDNYKVISSVSSILNSTKSDTTMVKMFTTNKNNAFDNEVISSRHLSNLNFSYPSYYKNTTDSSFVKMYQQRFGTKPNRYAARGFDVMYDLLLKLAYKNNLFEVTSVIGETQYSGTKFSYSKDILSGYFNNSVYIMKYDDLHIVEVKPSDDDETLLKE